MHLDLPNDYGYTLPASQSVAGAGIWGIIAAILAIVGGILAYFLFVNTKDTPKNKFLAWLKDFLAFKIMWIEVFVKIFYYITTIFVILFSFGLISINFLSFIGCLVMGPIVVRVIYENLLMLIMIWRNTQDIAKNTAKK